MSETEHADQSAVEAANTAFYEAFEAADLDAMTELWLAGGEALCIHPGAMPVAGAPAVARSWALIMANTPYIQFFLTDLQVSVVGDVASVACVENILTADEMAGEGSLRGARALATNVFVRTEAGWRLWIHHASPILSGPALSGTEESGPEPPDTGPWDTGPSGGGQ